ncbi:hypothetical protein OG982_29810 [Streptomyces sp. NBC_01551]|uniref:hypothetical protein n=1 Tax=Streptomyces sp. NBC_01551 TaxID=2975876 RepID=UPI002259B3F2|nr:hypothetical protein [Streptomyces sp. NBC_01551]MCX4529842.1 hypothetical protein [Streptomyces sp. NBC_01551]
MLDVLHRDRLALRIHDGAFSAMDLTARHPRTGELLSTVTFMVQTLAAAGELQRDLQRELTYDGLRTAGCGGKGNKGGRRPAVPADKTDAVRTAYREGRRPERHRRLVRREQRAQPQLPQSLPQLGHAEPPVPAFALHPRDERLPTSRTGRDERLDALGRLLTDADTPMRLRVAGVIVLLYAQPVTRIVQLTADDVLNDGEAMLLRLGEPASPVPAPVASLLLEYIADRDNMNTATNQAPRWLFPGRRAGQPARPDHLSALLREIGVPVAAARGAAIRQQFFELPAPVVAVVLGCHDKATGRLLRETGGTWSRYAAGDHLRSPSGWTARRTDGG